MPTKMIDDALFAVTDSINKAKSMIGRDDPVTLVAVSKQQPDERIDAALDAGQRVFGENACRKL
jgi:uncharacterized pyridoxal phosphate-containing UPF0001 family protein